MKFKHILRLLALVVCMASLTLSFTACGGNAAGDLDNVVYVEIDMESGDYMKLELYTTIAPITVSNFVELCEKNFYDGLIFHRVISGFMIQGGDPEGTGMGGSDKTIKGEFNNNGVINSLSHERGVISMARNSLSMDSASSQFFICHADSTFLDGDYAAFGRVIEGIETVDKIAAVATDGNDKPLAPQYIKTIRVITEEQAKTAGPAPMDAAETAAE